MLHHDDKMKVTGISRMIGEEDALVAGGREKIRDLR